MPRGGINCRRISVIRSGWSVFQAFMRWRWFVLLQVSEQHL